MALLFYSTNYSPDRARAEIQKLLLTIGARRISFEYTPGTVLGRVESISFTLITARGELEYELPARASTVRETLRKQGVLRGAGRRADPLLQRQHAEAVAWRTLLEWLKVQAAIIETEQAAPDEVMLPYMLVPSANGQRSTAYQQFAQTALPAGASA